MNKQYIDANELLENSFQLARNIYDSDFKPTALIALWRGGTPIGIAVQEGLSYLGIHTKHFALRTSYYNDKNEREDSVQIDNFGIIAEQIHADDQLLIVDDVFDSGNTINSLINKIQVSDSIPTPTDIRIATPYYKPNNNCTNLKPNYYVHQTNEWIVFPHELHGLSKEDILHNKPAAHALMLK